MYPNRREKQNSEQTHSPNYNTIQIIVSIMVPTTSKLGSKMISTPLH